MPCLLKKSSKALEMYSPPLSDLRTFATCSDCLSTKVFHSLNLANTSLLDLSTYTQILREKSSMKVRKYLAPPMDAVFIGPHTSECTSSKILVARVPPSVGNGRLACLPSTHPSHAKECTLPCAAPTSIPLTMLWSIFTLLALRCPNLLCQSSKECEFPSECAKELISTPFTTLVSNWYKLDSNDATANISPLLALTTHPNELKCTFKPFEMSLLTESKFECKSGT